MSLNLVCIRLNTCRWEFRCSRASIAMFICSSTKMWELENNENMYVYLCVYSLSI